MDLDSSKTLFALTAISITTGTLIYDLISIRSGKVRQHPYSWLIWGLITFVILVAQISDEAGKGTWQMSASFVSCLVRFIVSFFLAGERNITKGDKICLFGCLLGMAGWAVTQSAAVAVIILTITDAYGFYPTVRKSWINPYSENVISYFLFGSVYFFGTLALENYSITTALFPITACLGTWAFCLFLIVRRRRLVMA